MDPGSDVERAARQRADPDHVGRIGFQGCCASDRDVRFEYYAPSIAGSCRPGRVIVVTTGKHITAQEELRHFRDSNAKRCIRKLYRALGGDRQRVRPIQRYSARVPGGREDRVWLDRYAIGKPHVVAIDCGRGCRWWLVNGSTQWNQPLRAESLQQGKDGSAGERVVMNQA